MMRSVISTRALSKNYRDTIAVMNLDLQIAEGEVFGLLGPNGAGKTTTILMLLGLTEPSVGEVSVLGLDPRHHALEIKSSVGYVPDSVGFYDHLTGRQNLRYTTRLNRLEATDAESRIDEALAVVGMSEPADRKVGSYSRGMLQRLGLADALIKRPSVLILDEPTVNIDPAGVEEILALVRRLADDHGVAVLLSSHLLHQVQTVCDRIGIFVSGRLVAVGTIDELAAQLDDRILIEVGASGAADVVRAVVEAVDGVTAAQPGDGHWVVSAQRDVRGDIADALHDAGLSVSHLRRTSAELDAIYRRYFREDAEPAPAEDHADDDEH